jgi:hypothetical protein
MSVFNNGILGLKEGFDNNQSNLDEIQTIEDQNVDYLNDISNALTSMNGNLAYGAVTNNPTQASGSSFTFFTHTLGSTGTYMFVVNFRAYSTNATDSLITYALAISQNTVDKDRVYYALYGSGSSNQENGDVMVRGTFFIVGEQGDEIAIRANIVTHNDNDVYVVGNTTGVVYMTIGQLT